ncbi:MAG: hypothetical protein Q7K26_06250 [bacterium]|nr:hypothetical protein [bacterium]
MSYSKITTICGHTSQKPANWSDMTADQRYEWSNKNPMVSTHRNGFWKTETISKVAQKMGIVNEASASHCVIDHSGKGRGSSKQFKVSI